MRLGGSGTASRAPGPRLVTADEIAGPGNLRMTLDVSGRQRQDDKTRTMIFGVAALVSNLSQFTTLEPGATGTPPGPGSRPQAAGR